jgi:hypothetical protein
MIEGNNMAEQGKLRFRQVLGSVAAAFLGVQSGRNRERDFTQGRPRDFIVMGLLFTLVFILIIWGVVSLVMRVAQ